MLVWSSFFFKSLTSSSFRLPVNKIWSWRLCIFYSFSFNDLISLYCLINKLHFWVFFEAVFLLFQLLNIFFLSLIFIFQHVQILFMLLFHFYNFLVYLVPALFLNKVLFLFTVLLKNFIIIFRYPLSKIFDSIKSTES